MPALRVICCFSAGITRKAGSSTSATVPAAARSTAETATHTAFLHHPSFMEKVVLVLGGMARPGAIPEHVPYVCRFKGYTKKEGVGLGDEALQITSLA